VAGFWNRSCVADEVLGGGLGEELVEARVVALTKEDLNIEGLVGLRQALTEADWSPIVQMKACQIFRSGHIRRSSGYICMAIDISKV
jgi:hypothetical protein